MVGPPPAAAREVWCQAAAAEGLVVVAEFDNRGIDSTGLFRPLENTTETNHCVGFCPIWCSVLQVRR